MLEDASQSLCQFSGTLLQDLVGDVIWADCFGNVVCLETLLWKLSLDLKVRNRGICGVRLI